MNNRGLTWLVGACGVLLVILLMEWMIIGVSKDPSVEVLPDVKEAQTATIELPKLSIDKPSVDSYVAMVESPLFIEGRKPVVNEETMVTNQQIGKIDDLSLVGIYSIEGQVTALFKQQGTVNESLKRVEGDDVSGWRIKQIQPDKVIFEQAGKQQTMMLRALKIKPKVKKKPRTRINPFTKKPINPFAQKIKKTLEK